MTAMREIRDSDDRARALMALASHLPSVGAKHVLPLLREALAAAREIQYEKHRADALAALAPHLTRWAERDRQAAYTAWKETLPALARRTRQGVLSDIRALTPFIAALGGAEAVAETVRAVRDVGRWWP